MKTDAAKKFALEACGHWFNLEVEDMKDRLSVGLTLTKWEPHEDGSVSLEFSALPGHNFEIWAHKNWKWDGRFSIHISWLPLGEDGASYSSGAHSTGAWEHDYEISKEPGKRPFVLDLKHGQLWMSTSE
jgi:hypothetical protein